MEILSSGVADLSCSLNRCASMISRSHPWRTRPSATSLSLQTRSTSSWVAIMRTEKITSAMMVEKSKTDFFVCVSILFVCKIRFQFVNWFFLYLFPWIARYFLQCLNKEIPTAKELDLRPLGKVIIFRHTRGVTTDLIDVRFAQEYAQSIACALICAKNITNFSAQKYFWKWLCIC